MSNLWVNGYEVARTEKAIAIVPCERDTFKPAQNKALWVPISKIDDRDDGLVPEMQFTLDGERIARRGVSISLCIDEAFLAKVNAVQFGYC